MNNLSKYIITWCILISVPCSPKPHRDEFDRTPSHYNRETLEWCETFQKDCNHSRGFNDRDSAMFFYKEAISEQSPGLQGGGLIDVEIDSLIILDTISIETRFHEWNQVVRYIYSKDIGHFK